MSKETYFFRHDYHARNDHRLCALVSDHGAAGYGIYWCLVEMLHEETTHKLPMQDYLFRSVAKQMSTTAEQVLNIVQDCMNVYQLFSGESGFFFSNRVFKNISDREDIKEKRSKAGKISAEKRKIATSDEHVLTSVEQNSTKKRKVKEKKVKEKKVKEIEKVFYKPNVSLSDQEYKTLVEKHGQQKTDWMIDKLSSYKLSQQKEYKSDYGAINTWVVTAAEKDYKPCNTPVLPIRNMTLDEKDDLFGGRNPNWVG